jgi:hypothetical protein
VAAQFVWIEALRHRWPANYPVDRRRGTGGRVAILWIVSSARVAALFFYRKTSRHRSRSDFAVVRISCER